MSRQIVVWTPPAERPEAVEGRARKHRAAIARDAETEARLAVAEARETHARMMTTGRALVLKQLEKLLALAEHPDFASAPGPVELKDIIKLAELVSKDHRLSTGQATETIAHVLAPSIDFSKLTQEERNRWRELAVKGGADE